MHMGMDHERGFQAGAGSFVHQKGFGIVRVRHARHVHMHVIGHRIGLLGGEYREQEDTQRSSHENCAVTVRIDDEAAGGLPEPAMA